MKKGLSKRVVLVLVIIAIVLGAFSIVYTQFGLGEKISTTTPESSESGVGNVGINILPPTTEDKGIEGEDG